MKRLYFVAIIISVCAFVSASSQVVHVFIPLADNVNQNIVPVPSSLGDGMDPSRNLYWGAMYGMKSFFKRDKEWKLLTSIKKPGKNILERIVFKHQSMDAYIVADAYRGDRLKECIVDFLNATAGKSDEKIIIDVSKTKKTLNLNHNGSLLCLAGHNGFLDFELDSFPVGKKDNERGAVILSCWSKLYFKKPVNIARAKAVLWANERLAPEAYILKPAIEGWLKKNTPEWIHRRAAEEYARYQKCGLKGALRLLDVNP